MLGRLARWLRVLGYDTSWDAGIDDEELARRAAREDRILLTCDRKLAAERRPTRCLVLAPGDPLEQLRRVVEHFDLDAGGPLFLRCTQCNAPLEEVEKRVVSDLVPERTLRELDRFTRCPRCGRVYWEGSHTRRMRLALAQTLRG